MSSTAWSGAAAPDLRPLTARSVIASVLLGAHPPVLPTGALVRVGELFGIAEGTIRVALSRMTADGELTAERGCYRLGRAFEPRMAAQERGQRPAVRPWRGGWEVVIVTTTDPEPVGALRALRLAPAGGRTWLRPANLRRFEHEPWPSGVRRLEAAGSDDLDADRVLVRQLWDLDGWASSGDALLDALEQATSPAERFVVAAAVVRHLRTDPVLPGAVVVGSWPDRRLRAAYEDFSREMQELLAASTTR